MSPRASGSGTSTPRRSALKKREDSMDASESSGSRRTSQGACMCCLQSTVPSNSSAPTPGGVLGRISRPSPHAFKCVCTCGAHYSPTQSASHAMPPPPPARAAGGSPSKRVYVVGPSPPRTRPGMSHTRRLLSIGPDGSPVPGPGAGSGSGGGSLSPRAMAAIAAAPPSPRGSLAAPPRPASPWGAGSPRQGAAAAEAGGSPAAGQPAQLPAATAAGGAASAAPAADSALAASPSPQRLAQSALFSQQAPASVGSTAGGAAPADTRPLHWQSAAAATQPAAAPAAEAALQSPRTQQPRQQEAAPRSAGLTAGGMSDWHALNALLANNGFPTVYLPPRAGGCCPAALHVGRGSRGRLGGAGARGEGGKGYAAEAGQRGRGWWPMMWRTRSLRCRGPRAG